MSLRRRLTSLGETLRIEAVVQEVLTRFADVQSSGIDASVREALKWIAECFNADRARIIELGENSRVERVLGSPEEEDIGRARWQDAIVWQKES